MRPSRALILLAGLLALHQNYWMWDDTRVLLGLPVNLLFHAALCLLMPVLMYRVLRTGGPARGQ